MLAQLRRRAETRVRSEERRRAVSPVVGQPPVADVAHFAVVEVEHRQQFDGGDPERLQVRNLLDESGERARPRHPCARRPRESPDVRLVDDEILHRAVQRLVTLPVVVGQVDDGRTRCRRHVVAGNARRPADPQGAVKATGVRVDEHLLVIEPVSLTARLVAFRPEDAHSVEDWRTQTSHVRVPDGETAVAFWVESDALERFGRVVRVEQEQLHAGGMLGEEGETDAVGVGVGPERMAAAAFGGVDLVVAMRLRPFQRLSLHEHILCCTGRWVTERRASRRPRQPRPAVVYVAHVRRFCLSIIDRPQRDSAATTFS